MYRMIGGHDAELPGGDDHDLMVRFFLAGARFVHIPEVLYHYRVHGQNTVTTHNAAIQDGTWKTYNRHIWSLAEHFANEQKLLKVDLCGGIDPCKGYLVLDQHIPDGVNGLAANLENKWPLADHSVGVLRAHDAIEHLSNPIHTMNEAHRVLAPGGFLMISVPSSSGKGAFCDPTHVSYWNDLSFRYYTDQHFARYVPSFTGRFQLLRCIEWYPSDWHREVNMPYAEAHLVALGPGYEPMGEVLWPTRQG
jgi:SAM-dependent methyltransferase